MENPCKPYFNGQPFEDLTSLRNHLAEQYHSLKDDKNHPLVKALESGIVEEKVTPTEKVLPKEGGVGVGGDVESNELHKLDRTDMQYHIEDKMENGEIDNDTYDVAKFINSLFGRTDTKNIDYTGYGSVYMNVKKPDGTELKFRISNHPSKNVRDWDVDIRIGKDKSETAENIIQELYDGKSQPVYWERSSNIPPEPPKITPEQENNGFDSEAISIQRKNLLKEVQDRFYKPSDGSKSKSNKATLENALKDLADGAKKNKKTIDDYLQDKVRNWYNDLFDSNGNRKKNDNGSYKQRAFTDEEFVQLGIYNYKLEKKIKSSNTDDIIGEQYADKLNKELLNLQMVVGIAGESAGRSLGSLANFYKFNNNAEFEILRKAAGSYNILGKDIPLDNKEFETFKKGLNKKQQVIADIAHNALIEAKKVLDKNIEGWNKLPEEVAKAHKEEVHKQVEEAYKKGYEAAKKEWQKGDSNKSITDNKGRVKKGFVNKFSESLLKIADDIEKNNRFGGNLPEGTQVQGVTGGKNLSKSIADAIRRIAEKIKEFGNSIPDLIDKETDYLVNEGYDEKEVRDALKMKLKEAGVSDDIINSKTSKQTLIDQIKEHSKNAKSNTITKESANKGLIQDLYLAVRNDGVSIDKIDDTVMNLLKDNGIETDTNDLNEAYLNRGKYKRDSKRDIDDGQKQNQKAITEHEKLIYDINKLDSKIKEIKENGSLSLEQKDAKTAALNLEKEAKKQEFIDALRDRGIKLERGSKYSQEAKWATIESHNDGVNALGDKVIQMLNEGKFDNLSEGSKNFLRGLRDRLLHDIKSAPDLDAQMDIINGKLSAEISNLFRNQSKEGKPEDISLRANKNILEVQKELEKLKYSLRNDRQKTAEDIALKNYENRLIRERDEFIRRKAAGEWDDTKLSVDVKESALTDHLYNEKQKAKYDFYRALKQAQDQNDSKVVKFLKEVKGLSRWMLLSGYSYIQGKVLIASVLRNLQIASRAFARGYGKILGASSVQGNLDIKADWEGAKATLLGKTEKSAIEDTKKSSEELKIANDNLNLAQKKYKDLIIKHNGDDNNPEVVSFKANELDLAKAKYDVAALKHNVNTMYSERIIPNAWDGRIIIIKTGLSKEQAESGLLGKKESFRDYLTNVNYDKMKEGESIEEFNNRMESAPKKVQKAYYLATFIARGYIRTHGAEKDIAGRASLVSGYIKRLREAQKNGQDISDPLVSSRAWNAAVHIDEQEAIFQSSNKASDLVRKGQSGLAEVIGGKHGELHDIAKVLTDGLTPVLKVPMNIYWAKLQYNFGLLIGAGHILHIASKAAHEEGKPIYKLSSDEFKRFFKSKVSDEERHMILTSLGRGTFGLAAMITGYALQRSGAMVSGGAYPDPKKFATLSDGSEVELEYGDLVINGVLIPHWIAKGLEHIPQFDAFFTGHDFAEYQIRAEGNKDIHPYITALYKDAEKKMLEGLPLPIEREKNSFGVKFTPYSYLGYVGIVKDAERMAGAGKDKAKGYQMTGLENIYDNMGLLWLVPSEQEAEDRMEQQKQNAYDISNNIKEQYPNLFRKK